MIEDQVNIFFKETNILLSLPSNNLRFGNIGS